MDGKWSGSGYSAEQLQIEMYPEKQEMSYHF